MKPDYDNIRHGFIKSKNIKSVKKISTSEPFDRIDIEEKGMQGVVKKLLEKLINKIIEENLLYIEVTEDFEPQQKRFHGELTLCPPGTKFSHVHDDQFVVKGESFTEQDLIKAVKAQFPERFI